MKLESYVIAQTLRSGKVDRAIDLVLKHFNLSRPPCKPRLRLTSPDEPLGIAMWNHTHYYSWTDDVGFYTTDEDGDIDRRAIKLSTIQVFRHRI